MQFYLLTENFFGSVSEQNMESGTCVHDFLTQIFKLSVAECDIITVVDSASHDYFVYRFFGIVGLSCKQIIISSASSFESPVSFLKNECISSLR
jgi:hypothetical protein